MVFGRIKRAREKKADKAEIKQKDAQEDEKFANSNNPEEDVLSNLDMASRISERLKSGLDSARQKGEAQAEATFGKETQGLSPGQRQNLQEQANRQISRDFQGYQRDIIGKQGQRGVRGGAAYAQQADLARLAGDAQQEFQRDLANVDSDLAMKKLAQIFSVGQGAMGEEVLRNQQAIDLLSDYENKRYNRGQEKQYNRYFQRL